MKRTFFFIFLISLLGLSLTSCNQTSETTTDGICEHSFTTKTVAPSCTDGYTIFTCKDCSFSYSDQYVTALGHVFEDTLEDQSCDTYKTVTHTCSRCGYSYKEDTETLGTIHDYKVTSIYPTKTEAAYYRYDCQKCEKSYEEAYVENEAYSLGLAYTERNGRYFVSGLGSCMDKRIRIPSVNEHGKTVEGVLMNAITGDFVLSCEIGEGIKSLDKGAITNCKNLETIVFPSTIETAEASIYNCPAVNELTVIYNESLQYDAVYTFFDASDSEGFGNPDLYLSHASFMPTALTKLNIGGTLDSKSIFTFCSRVKEVTILEGVSNLPICFFSNLDQLEKVTLPSTVTAISYECFYNCDKLTEIVATKNLKTIGQDAFNQCVQLEKIDLSSVTVIQEKAFYGCSALSDITFSDTLAFLGKMAFAKTSITKIKLPSSLMALNENTFEGCEKLVMADLSSVTITELPAHLFKNCYALETVSLSSSITSIDPTVFTEEDSSATSYALSLVIYSGSSSEWSNISGTDSAVLKTASIIFQQEF